jgi:hypothetical protein
VRQTQTARARCQEARERTWRALAAIVALGAGETPGADGSNVALKAGWAAISWTTRASVVSGGTWLTSRTWQTESTSEANVSSVSFVAFGALGTRRPGVT